MRKLCIVEKIIGKITRQDGLIEYTLSNGSRVIDIINFQKDEYIIFVDENSWVPRGLCENIYNHYLNSNRPNIRKYFGIEGFCAKNSRILGTDRNGLILKFWDSIQKQYDAKNSSFCPFDYQHEFVTDDLIGIDFTVYFGILEFLK